VNNPANSEDKFFQDSFNAAWEEAERHGGDFKDCLLHYLARRLGFEKVEPEPRKPDNEWGIDK